MEKAFRIEGHIIDVLNRRRFDGAVTVDDGCIAAVEELPHLPEEAPCVMPGFVDSHIHIESSMLLPERFGEVAMRHGTVAVVCDPHEIATVLGVEGIDFMIENSRSSAMKMCFVVPSCVPSTGFETAGAELGVEAVEELMRRPDIYALGEMMNSVGVVMDDPVVMGKIAAAAKAGKPIDGHAPLLTGEWLRKYAAAGISTDHECTTVAEAEEKLSLGMSILMRCGSAANDFGNLMPLLATHGEGLMLCSDDKHPDDLLEGHINLMVRRAVAEGYPIWNVLWAACVEPTRHYRLPVGLLRRGDPADFILVDNAASFNVLQTYIGGEAVVSQNPGGKIPKSPSPGTDPNNFNRRPLSVSDIAVPYSGGRLRVIEAHDGSIITGQEIIDPLVEGGLVVADTDRDILKIVVANRYNPDTPPQVAFISGFGLKKGAMASTIAHDCHNLIAVGSDDRPIVAAMNRLIEEKGGIAVCEAEGRVDCLPLPVAGLMSAQSAEVVAETYHRLNAAVHSLGCPFNAPFMTLSFMALPVIPEIKLTDKGLFDFSTFSFTNLFTE